MLPFEKSVDIWHLREKSNNKNNSCCSIANYQLPITNYQLPITNYQI
ncbi:MAG: hypothetical protein HC942_04750 [Microcoleus sp. SU_5_6]|nr:hypothetical protein [Microcoleus sp. SU_5_6]